MRHSRMVVQSYTSPKTPPTTILLGGTMRSFQLHLTRDSVQQLCVYILELEITSL